MVAQRPSSDLAVPTQNLAELSYNELMALDLDETRTRDLVEKEELLGVPFVITSFTFRQSDMAKVEYVSVEATTKDDRRIVFNDGSTGIRRDLVNYCAARELFTVLDGSKFDPNDSLYDMIINDVIDIDHDMVAAKPDSNGMWNLTVRVPRGVFVRKGLRKSDYGPSPDYDPKNGTGRPAGTTYYLA